MGETALTDHDIVIDARVACSQDHFEILNGIVPHANVLRDGIFKEGDILIDDTDRTGEDIAVDLPDRHAVKCDGTAPGLVEPGDQLGQGGFAAARPADNGNLLPRLDGQGEIGNQRGPQP